MKKVRSDFIKNLHYLCLACVIALGLMTIIATGGGGGENSELIYVGKKDQANIDETNAEELAMGAFEGGYTGSSFGAMSDIQPEESVNNVYSYILTVSRILKDSINYVHLMSISERTSILAIYTDTGTINGECGGSASYSIRINDQTGNFSGTLNFLSYCVDLVTISGTVSFSGQVNIDTKDLIKYRISFGPLTGSSGTESMTLQGDISFDNTEIKMTMLICYDSTGKVYWVRDYTVTLTADSLELSGKYYDPGYGYVILDTTTPFRFYNDEHWPSEGELIIMGVDNTSAKLTMLPSFTYQVKVDIDGDGEYDWDSGVLYYQNQLFPCLDEAWGWKSYTLKDQNDNNVYLQSHGSYVWVSTLVDYQGTGSLAVIGMTGPPIDCLHAELDFAKFILSGGDSWDYETTNVVGEVSINLNTLTISGLIIDSHHYPDIIAKY